MNDEIKIVVADGDTEQGQSLALNLSLLEGLHVCAFADTGPEVLKVVETYQPDILLMDLVLQEIDGLGVLKRLHDMPGKRPGTIIFTQMITGESVQLSLRYGARYVMLKPAQLERLQEVIREIAEGPAPAQPLIYTQQPTSRSLDEEISSVFLSIGIPAHIKGYQFLREAVKMVMDEPRLINAITKELYPGIGARFHTTASKVERAIRHAIEVAWTRGKIENINEIFGCTIYSHNEKPTNGEFIALVADKLRTAKEDKP